MKGLILKDFYISVKYLRSCFVMMAGFIAVSIFSEDLFFMAVYPSLVCGMVPQSLLSCDERSKWDSYCGTLPITKAEFVSGKYIIVLLLIALSLIVSGIGHGVKIIATGSMEWNTWWMILAFILVLGCLGVAIQLPVMFRFGTEKGRIAYWLMVILVSGGSALTGNMLKTEELSRIPVFWILPLLCLVSLGIFALSWFLSIKFYEKREIG